MDNNNKHRQQPSICYEFRNTGKCTRGEGCRYSHVSSGSNGPQRSREDGYKSSQYGHDDPTPEHSQTNSPNGGAEKHNSQKQGKNNNNIKNSHNDHNNNNNSNYNNNNSNNNHNSNKHRQNESNYNQSNGNYRRPGNRQFDNLVKAGLRENAPQLLADKNNNNRNNNSKSDSSDPTMDVDCSLSPAFAQHWVPPKPDLARVTLNGYKLNFPLELTNKDYIRRVLDIVAVGIQSGVMDVTRSRGLEAIDTDNVQDVYYLLKQVKHNVPVFARELAVASTDTLRNACDYLFQVRNRFAHMEPETSRLDALRALFTHSDGLLEQFGPRAVSARQRLQTLIRQYDEHQSFKEMRVQAFGWCWDAVTTDDVETKEDESTDEVETLLTRCRQMCEAMETLNANVEQQAHTRLVVRLQGYASGLHQLMDRSRNDCNYVNAQAYLKLKELVETALDIDGKEVITDANAVELSIGSGRSRIASIEAKINDASALLTEMHACEKR